MESAWRRSSKTCTKGSRAARIGRARLGGCTSREGGRAAATARHCHAGGQDRPAGRRRGAQRRLRGGLSRLLLRIPAGAKSPRCARCADGRDRTEEGELGTRRRCQRFLHQSRSRLAGTVCRAPHSGQEGPAADPQMGQRRGDRGREMVGERGRGAPGGVGFAAARQHLPPLRPRPMGPAVEASARTR